LLLHRTLCSRLFMKTLLLLRHAKSDWDDISLDDHERPLNPRGLKAAPRMGQLMRDLGMIPELSLSSTAVRSRDTTTLAIDALGHDVPTEFVEKLYSFGEGEAIEEVIAAQGGDASPLLIVAHNPAMQALAVRLCDGGDVTGLAQMRMKYPTAGLARIDFDIENWSELPGKTGTLVNFWRPRDIM
jgi:phosphohistidine phosphatase